MMKQTFLLIALCVCFGLSALAQSAVAPEEKATKRITITSKKIDESGKTTTETWIAEGDEPTQILQNMAINPEVLQQVEWEKTSVEGEEERLFLFRKAGEKVVIEGTLNENTDSEAPRHITAIIQDDVKGETRVSIRGNRSFPYTPGRHGPAGPAWSPERQFNCAALGVFTVRNGETTGARITSLIDNGGAIEAGLQPGDVIKSIDEFEVIDFSTLHLALSHFRPGDHVNVRYDREGTTQSASVDLKAWPELKGYESRTRNDCMEPEAPVEELPLEKINDEPSFTPALTPLVLENATLYPNPTDGVFALSFNAAPGPLSVSIADINGKIVFYQDNDNLTGAYKQQIDISHLPQGNYIISITQNDSVFTKQISRH